MVKPPSQIYYKTYRLAKMLSTHNFNVHFSPPLNGLAVRVCITEVGESLICEREPSDYSDT